MTAGAYKRDPHAPRGGQPDQFKKYVRPVRVLPPVPRDPFQKATILATSAEPDLHGWTEVRGGYQRKVYLG
jgi:hypothetical protein